MNYDIHQFLHEQNARRQNHKCVKLHSSYFLRHSKILLSKDLIERTNSATFQSRIGK